MSEVTMIARFVVMLFSLVADPCQASALDSDAVAITNGLASQLAKIFPSEAEPVVKKAIAEGLVKALGDEFLDTSEVLCIRDYSQLCPSGWVDSGDASTCQAPKDYQGKCKPKLAWGGLTPQQKRQQASRCAAAFPCLDQCAADYSQPCPQGWLQDVNQDCLAPTGYSGRCVLRKSFSGMKQSEKTAWGKACDVSWPCRKSIQNSQEIDRMRVKGGLNQDCVSDYEQACPEHYELKEKFCVAPEGSSGRCGFELSSKYNQEEKAAYAKSCNVAWPCKSF